jgi:GH24 family phage-related lysozyme (muramidase)
MHPSVRSAFQNFTQQFEGAIPFMYLDVKGLVTTGIGNLIDPIGAALDLPWRNKKTKAAASRAEIETEWKMVKGRTDLEHTLARKGGTWDKITTLELSDESIATLVDGKLSSNEATLKKYFPDFDKWPADAQLGVLSMAWALGPAFPATWPKFKAAALAQDWNKAAANSHISEAGNPGVAPRNRADKVLFENAAVVQGDPDDYTSSVLYYPTIVLPPVVITAGG